MDSNFRYADIHCHPNLKTFGHSFDKKKNPRSDIWHTVPATPYLNRLRRLTGITKFSQTDLTSMSKGGAKLAFVSLYPFEKGFFINKRITPSLAARLADFGIEVGYQRIRNIQNHTDYFSDLLNEYNFFINAPREKIIDGKLFKWVPVSNADEAKQIEAEENTIAVIMTIEGAHVFNTGLSDFGRAYSEEIILENIRTVKNWEYPPISIGIAHNFNNDLCGHVESLQRLGTLVDQRKNINLGLFDLGRKVINEMLDQNSGRRILIDLKHMSVLTRKDYAEILAVDYASRKIPKIVSHGAVTGKSFNGKNYETGALPIFNTGDINFYDEEIIDLVKSGGLFAIQLDIGINMDGRKKKSFLAQFKNEPEVKKSARIIFNQLLHIAMLCDLHELPAWNNTCLGSDFDGSITPFPGIVNVVDFRNLATELIPLVDDFLKSGKLRQAENRNISPEEIVDRFIYLNTAEFVQKHYRS